MDRVLGLLSPTGPTPSAPTMPAVLTPSSVLSLLDGYVLDGGGRGGAQSATPERTREVVKALREVGISHGTNQGIVMQQSCSCSFLPCCAAEE